MIEPKSAALVLSLLARDLIETRKFYETLGFCLSGGAPESGWMELKLGSARLQFYKEPPIGTLKTPSLSGTIYVQVPNVDSIAESLKADFTFEWGPETMDYGMREFALRDPSGYLLAFSAPA